MCAVLRFVRAFLGLVRSHTHAHTHTLHMIIIVMWAAVAVVVRGCAVIVCVRTVTKTSVALGNRMKLYNDACVFVVLLVERLCQRPNRNFVMYLYTHAHICKGLSGWTPPRPPPVNRRGAAVRIVLRI